MECDGRTDMSCTVSREVLIISTVDGVISLIGGGVYFLEEKSEG